MGTDGARANDRVVDAPRRHRRATITDVAKKAGVSKGLVSFVLNDRPGVAPATRDRILDAVRELDWRPRQAARSLTNDRAYAMGFVLARPAALLAVDPFFPAFIAGAEGELSARNSALVLQVVPDVDAELETYRRMVADNRVDGVLVADLRVDDPRPTALAKMSLPAVTLGRPDRPGSGPAVVLDDAPGVVASVEHLADLGHERVAFVGGPDTFLHARHRRDAWRKTLERRGLRFDDRFELAGDFSAASGARAMALLLDAAPRDRPTGVLFANDLMAVAGVAEAQRRGCRVPDDISVVGFDDMGVAAHMHPSLTTVAQDAVAWGAAATRAVFDLVEHQEASDVELPPARLVIRGSTAQAPERPRTGRRRTASNHGDTMKEQT